MSRPRARAAALGALVVVLAAAAAVGGFAVTRSVRGSGSGDSAVRTPAASTPAALPGATRAPSTAASLEAPVPVASAVARVLTSALAAPGLGGRVRARVVDAVSGAVLFDRDGSTPAAPASTAKVLTASALLSLRPATYRISTTVVSGVDAATIVLVGGGDPTLTAAAAGSAGPYPGAARISDLATQVRRAHPKVSRIIVDDSLFTGPTVSPAWAAEDVPSNYASAITPVLADGGRSAPGDQDRSTQPDLAAGRSLAAALGKSSVTVSRGRAPAAAKVLGTVKSAPISTLISQMMLESDNVIAECLARQVALAKHEPASFTGAAHAVRGALTDIGVDPGSGLVDGSGLAASDRVSAVALAGVLRAVAVDADGSLRSVLTALPVAGWSGTLTDRYVAGSASSAAGVVRAKTGTLTGVSALAGLIHDRDGRLLTFAIVADRTASTGAAEAALDVVAAGLASCGCS